MTNLNFKRFTGVALLLLGISACNKEVSEPQYSEASQSAQPKTEQVYLDIITSGSEEMRLSQKVDDTGATTGVFMEERDLAIQVAVRRKGEAQAATQLLRFAKIKGAARARYTGFVEVPLGTGNEVEIAGIVLGEWTGDSKTEPQPTDVKFMTRASNDFFQSIKPAHLLTSQSGVVRTQIPYIANWTTAHLTAPEGGKQRIEPVALYFKPSGTILRLQLRNSLNKQVKVTQIKVKTNVFVEQWQYKFANGLIQNDQLMAGELISGTLPLSEQTYTWQLEQPITLSGVGTGNSDATQSQWLYTWVMGTKSFVGPRKIEFSLVAEGGTTYNAVFKTSAELKYGQTMWIPLTVASSKLGADFGAAGDGEMPSLPVLQNPLSRVPITQDADKYALFLSGRSVPYSFIDPRTITTSEMSKNAPIYYSGDGARRDLADVTIGSKRYCLPNTWEWAAVLPGHGATWYAFDNNHRDPKPELDGRFTEKVQFSSTSEPVQADSYYRGNGTNILYAVRFTNIPDRLTAFRYEYKPNAGLVVTARYLGDQPIPSIDIVAKEDYWRGNNQDDFKLTLRALGYRGPLPASETVAFDVAGAYWTATPIEGPQSARRSHYVGFIPSRGVSGNFANGNDSHFNVILFLKD